MARTAILRILIEAQNNASNAMNQLGNSAGGAADKLKGLAAAAAAGAAVGAFLNSAVQAASRLQQATGGVEAVFKSSAGSIKSWASQAASSIGLSTAAYEELATVIGSQLKNAGVAMEDLAPATDALIQQGADLAAMYGGTTADAVGALSSALKGERDPIEKYGISITDAAIKAEILALGLDTSTNAAQQNAKAMATMSIVTRQGADAWGAAAREQDTFAAAQQRLSATWENMMAAVGGPLLGVVADFADAAADAAIELTPLITAVSTAVGWILDLPGPILAAAAAFTAWQVFGGNITSTFTKLRTQAGLATSSMSGFGNAVKGIASSLAGGAVFAGITVAIMVLINEFTRAGKAAREATTDYQGVVDALVESNGAWSDAAQSAKDAAILQSDAFSGLVEAGFSASDAIKILTGTQEEWIALRSAVSAGADENREAVMNLTKDTTANVDAMIDANGAAQGLADAQLEGAAALREGAGAAGENTAAVTLNAAEQAKLAEAQAKAALEAAKLAAEQTGVSSALNFTKAAAAEASRALEFFTIAMDTLAGRTPSVEQATKSLNDSMRDSAAAFKAASEAGELNMAALTDWNVAALTSTATGSALYDTVTKNRAAYDLAATAAYSAAGGAENVAAAEAAARDAAHGAYEAFITMATGATGSAVAAEQLAQKLGIVDGQKIDPKVFEVLAQDAQAQASLSQLQSTQIDPKDVLVTATVDPATAAIKSAASSVYSAIIGAKAEAKPAQAAITDVAKADYQATIDADAKTQQAQSQITQVAAAAYQATINVQANTSGAQGAITSLVNQQRTLTITVVANTSAAQSAINAITSGYYTATINVTANTAAASAAIAAVPRSVTVQPPPAPAGFGLMATEAPPVVTTYSARQAIPAAAVPVINYNISVTGADDPDGTARKIERVMRARERRIGGVHVG